MRPIYFYDPSHPMTVFELLKVVEAGLICIQYHALGGPSGMLVHRPLPDPFTQPVQHMRDRHVICFSDFEDARHHATRLTGEARQKAEDEKAAAARSAAVKSSSPQATKSN